MKASERKFQHLLLSIKGKSEDFTAKGGGDGKRPSPVADRFAHAEKLLAQLASIQNLTKNLDHQTDVPKDDRGVYVAVSARPGETLAYDSLDSSGSKLLGKFGPDQAQMAAIILSEKAGANLGEKIIKYRDSKGSLDKNGNLNFSNQSLVQTIDGIRPLKLNDIWSGQPLLFPSPGTMFRWETWLLPGTWERFSLVAKKMGIKLAPAPLAFPEIDIALAFATPEQMEELMQRTLCIARVGRSSVTAEFFDSLPAPEQNQFVKEALSRLNATPPDKAKSSVCVLDTGVNRGHPLLAPFLSVEDCHAVDSGWGESDHDDHGTEMAGVALFGDLTRVLDGSGPIAPPHRLESVKMFPPKGENQYDQLGVITRQAVEIAETQGGDLARTYCLATTTGEDTPHDGFPTIWSAELDQITVGKEVPGGARRIICVSAGNIRDQLPNRKTYPKLNDNSELESPGQSWNALTIGAFTEMQVLTDPKLNGHKPLAPKGDISPYSRTASWEKTWPIKPELVMEGGNLAVSPAENPSNPSDLSILTTCKDFPTPFLTTTWATSPATADAARLSAILSADYPHLWPETIRALLVNSASWTPAMLAHVGDYSLKTRRRELMRRYGYGVPDLERARRSAANCLTLIVQDSVKPYKKHSTEKKAAINEMKLFELPWPLEALEALSGDVSMRVTLSYFIEPNPSEAARGYTNRYASHGLRFKLSQPDEYEDDDKFRVRINKAAAQELNGVTSSKTDSSCWRYGQMARDVGSIHSDIWEGPASDLARCNRIAVHPVGGWWKERYQLNRFDSIARFSLVVTIDAGNNDVDIYTPVVNQLAAMV